MSLQRRPHGGHRRGERRRGRRGRDPFQFSKRGVGRIEIALLRARANEQLERRRARGWLGVAGLGEEPVEQHRRLGGVAALERQLGDADARLRLRRRLFEQAFGLVEPALAKTQHTEARDRWTREPRASLLQLARRRREFRFGLRPVAVPDEHTGVLRATDRRKRAKAPPPREFLHACDPLRGAVVVAHALAGENLPTRDEADGVQLLHLSRGRRDAGFVEAPHPELDVTRADARESLESERGKLDPLIPGFSAELRRARGTRDGGGRIVPAKERDLGLANHEPAVLGCIVSPDEQTPCALEPSRRHGEVAAKSQVVPHQPDRDARRTAGVVPLAIQRVRSLARVERERGFVEPPRGKAEVLEGLGSLAFGDARREVRTSLVPRTTIDRVASDRERIATGLKRARRDCWRGVEHPMEAYACVRHPASAEPPEVFRAPGSPAERRCDRSSCALGLRHDADRRAHAVYRFADSSERAGGAVRSGAEARLPGGVGNSALVRGGQSRPELRTRSSGPGFPDPELVADVRRVVRPYSVAASRARTSNQHASAREHPPTRSAALRSRGMETLLQDASALRSAASAVRRAFRSRPSPRSHSASARRRRSSRR